MAGPGALPRRRGTISVVPFSPEAGRAPASAPVPPAVPAAEKACKSGSTLGLPTRGSPRPGPALELLAPRLDRIAPEPDVATGAHVRDPARTRLGVDPGSRDLEQLAYLASRQNRVTGARGAHVPGSDAGNGGSPTESGPSPAAVGSARCAASSASAFPGGDNPANPAPRPGR